MKKESKNSSIRLIGMDCDNTLYHGADSLARVAPWFERLHRLGIKLGLVTGRPYDSLRELFEADGYNWGNPFPDFAICFESRILDARGHTLPGCEQWNKERDADIERAHAVLERVCELWQSELKSENIVCCREYLDPNYGLYLEFGTPEESIAACKQLAKRADPNHQLRFVRNCCGLSIYAQNRSKGPAMASLLRTWNIPQQEILVIGDSHNDLCMMNGDYHYQVATVSNADPVIRGAVEKKRGIISSKPFSHGVIDIFEQLFSNSPSIDFSAEK